MLNIRVDDSHEQALSGRGRVTTSSGSSSARTGGQGYMGDDGKPGAARADPTLEESVEQKVWIIGSAEEVAEGIAEFRDALSLRYLTVFPHFPARPTTKPKSRSPAT